MTGDRTVDWSRMRFALPEDRSAGRNIETDCIRSERRKVSRCRGKQAFISMACLSQMMYRVNARLEREERKHKDEHRSHEPPTFDTRRNNGGQAEEEQCRQRRERRLRPCMRHVSPLQTSGRDGIARWCVGQPD